MNTAGIHDISVYTDFNSLANIRHASKANDEDTIRGVANQFEAIFLQTLLSNMRNAELGDDIFSSDQSKLYQDLFDKQISATLAGNGSLGLADLLISQLKQVGSIERPGNVPNDILESQQTPAHDIVTSYPVAHEINSSAITSPEEFISHLSPVAKKVAEQHGFSEKLLLAQAALETGWGRYTLQHADGDSSYNLFGIKSAHGWDGATVTSSTTEYNNGVASRSIEKFRAYDNYESSLEDYVSFIKTQPRYKQAYDNRQNPEVYLTALQDAGYATDPKYANKIIKILDGIDEKYNMAAVKNQSQVPLT